MPRIKWFTLAVAPLLLAFSSAKASGQDALYAVSEPASYFSAGAQYLFTTRDTNFVSPGAFIDGPDSARVGFGAADFGYKSGVQAFLGYHSDGVRVEAIFSDYGAWNFLNSGTLTTGLAFDEGINPGNPWAGANHIDLTTGFESLHAAASGGMGGDADEFEGLGPVVGVADDFPTYSVLYRSIMQSYEVNVVTEDPEARVQIGLGYRHISLDEISSVGIEGSLRAPLALGPQNGGISHNSLVTFGGLTHVAGTANGFEDETSNPSTLPDTLQMFHDARTSNSLNGAQVILSEQFMYWKGWTIDGIAKAGAYHNHVKASVSETYIGTDPGPGGDSSTYGRTFSDTKSQLAFASSVGLQSNFPLSDHWSLISGYEMTYIYGVALSPEQYAGVTGATFVTRTFNADTHGEIIAHGGNAGLQFSY